MRNSKKILVLISLLLLITGCSKSENVEPEKIVNELDNKFEYVSAKCLKDKTLVRYKTFDRGDEVEIINQDNDFYYIEDNYLTLAIKKAYVRKNSEEQFKEYTGYARSGASLYSDVELKDKKDTLKKNDEVEVIDEIGEDVLLVKVNGTEGFMEADEVSKTKIPDVKKKESSSGSGDSGSGYTPAPYEGDGEDIEVHPSQPSSGDGEDIQLSASGSYTVMTLAAGSEKAKILVNGTKAYITIYNRGDEVKVLDTKDGVYTVVVEGRIGYIDGKYLRLASEVDYLAWDGYAKSGSAIYEDFELTEKIQGLSVNTKVHIIDEVEDRFVVELEDGTIGYMKASSISDEKIYIAPKKPVETPSYTPSTPAPEPVPEWTDPIL